MGRAQRNEERLGIDGQRPGTARPFPLWRLPSGPDSPPIDPIFGSGIAPRPERDHLTSGRLVSSARAAAFCNPDHIVQQCGPLATYRRVSWLSASTICRCITACRSDGRRAGVPPSHIAGRISWSAAGFVLLVLIGLWDGYEQETKALGFSGLYERYLASQAGFADDPKAYRAVVEAERARTAGVGEMAAIEE